MKIPLSINMNHIHRKSLKFSRPNDLSPKRTDIYSICLHHSSIDVMQETLNMLNSAAGREDTFFHIKNLLQNVAQTCFVNING